MADVLNPEQAQIVVDMLPTARSFREIARALGVRLDAVRGVAVPIVTLMRMTGSLELCPCGKPRFHPYGCGGEHNVLRKRGIRPPVSDDLLARRQLAIEMLISGTPYRHVDDALGMGHGGARAYMRFLTPEQCELRRIAVSKRGCKRVGRPPDEVRRALIKKGKARDRRQATIVSAAPTASETEWSLAA